MKPGQRPETVLSFWYIFQIQVDNCVISQSLSLSFSWAGLLLTLLGWAGLPTARGDIDITGLGRPILIVTLIVTPGLA